MKDWQPDEQFLDFLIQHYKKKLNFLELGMAAAQLNLERVIDEMREGTPQGIKMYENLYNLPKAQQDYKRYLKARLN